MDENDKKNTYIPVYISDVIVAFVVVVVFVSIGFCTCSLNTINLFKYSVIAICCTRPYVHCSVRYWRLFCGYRFGQQTEAGRSKNFHFEYWKVVIGEKMILRMIYTRSNVTNWFDFFFFCFATGEREKSFSI